MTPSDQPTFSTLFLAYVTREAGGDIQRAARKLRIPTTTAYRYARATQVPRPTREAAWAKKLGVTPAVITAACLHQINQAISLGDREQGRG